MNDQTGSLTSHMYQEANPIRLSTDSELLRVATFNVQLGARIKEIAHAINTSSLRDADVILLQEVENHEREGAPRAHQIGAASGLHSLYVPARLSGQGTHGIAMLSRHTLDDVSISELPQMDLGKKTRRRVAFGCTATVREHKVRFVNLHLDTRINAIDRMQQVQHAMQLGSGDYKAVIVAGDFNAFQVEYRRFGKFTLPIPSRIDQGRVVDTYMTKVGYTSCATSSKTSMRGLGGFLGLRADRIYAYGAEHVESEILTNVRCSDHFPLQATFRI